MTDTYSARDIANVLRLEAPTEEQQAVIEAPPQGVYRVIAGAGSGKTETMALRVLFLIANGHVAPQDVLGLTFTKKAAGELNSRLVRRIQALSNHLPELDAIDVFDRPKVHTYNAFATRIFSDYSVYLGVDGDPQVQSQASAWGLARHVVKNSDDERLAQWGVGIDRIASLVLRLAQSLGENDVDEAELIDFVGRFRLLAALPNGGSGSYAEVDKYVDAVSALEPLVALVRQFQAAKAERGQVEFSDQVRFALEVVRGAPDVVDVIRATHKVVLLDEYQDTSVLQSKLLSGLFSDHPVMAVGDPNQAIYGWRGASAGNLADFPTQFARDWQQRTFSLSTSWRNSHAVLAAANALAAPLTEKNPEGVVTLEASPTAGPGSIHVDVSETLSEEAVAVAEWFSSRLARPLDGDKPPTAALLLRNRSHQDVFVRALKDRGIPVHVLGIGGLLYDPVVADLVCGLAVIHQPEANTELVRLLAGGRFRLGVADLHALSKTARMLQRGHQKATPDSDAADVIPPALSLGEALDWLATTARGHRVWESFSEDAAVRFVEAARLIAERRRFLHDDIIDQIMGWEKAVGLDLETLAHPDRSDSLKARSALLEAAANYQASAEEPSVVGFLDWLREAEWRDNLQPQTEEGEPGCVQVLTIHGAKGLEWDFVAIPRMVDQELPSTSREGTKGWLTRGELPYPLRGDRDHLPHFSWQQAGTRKEVKDLADEFSSEVAHWQLTEERRLVYVAVTRAKSDVGLFGSWWATQKRPRKPSVFLADLEQAGLIEALPKNSQYDDNPVGEESDSTLWPADPLGERRESVSEAARVVREALAAMPEAMAPDGAAALDAAIAREKTAGAGETPALPFRLAASSLQAILHQPDAVMEARQRPTPRRVFGQERRGTAFHEWVEKHFQDAGHLVLAGDWGLDDDGDLPESVDMESWREAFLASDFAHRSPVAIEREIHLPLAGHVIVCKIDAVFATESGVDIIDWKTGRPPANADEEKARSLQLSLYRLAWSEWTGLEPEKITAGWWFSQTGQIQRPTSLLGRAELEDALADATRRYGDESKKR